MKLVIVESPAKAATIKRFLGDGYEVAASFGHIRDLPRSASEIPARLRSKQWGRLGVDVDGDFEPVYVIPRESKKHITALRQKARQADELILATDEDREGESISWHLLEVLKPKVPVQRIAFHEITRTAIRAALANPRQVNEQLVRAQETRRVLDRLFGYSLSPVLWRRVRGKLSAGRVQSAALRLLVEREEERQRFKVSEYWGVRASLQPVHEGEDGSFTADLVETGGAMVATAKNFASRTGELKRAGNVRVLDEPAAARIARDAMDARPWRVRRVEEKDTKRRPSPPFTTSTLQQLASSMLRMTPRRTMALAQQLYEGIDLGGGRREGLITYMRTDSVSLGREALSEAARFIRERFGDEYHQGTRQYATRSRTAQEAHEAIRPTQIGRTPEALGRFLDRDQLRLYGLIWRRTVASQMADARIARTTIELQAGADPAPAARAAGSADQRGKPEEVTGSTHVFRASGSVVRFPGFQRVWGTKREDVLLPRLAEGQLIGGAHTMEAPPTLDAPPDAGRDGPTPVDITSVEPRGHRTRPRPRYSEAALVRKLEEEGIGRPSTYEPTLRKLRDREYAIKKKGVLVPTYLGLVVIQLLRDHFPEYVNLKFTAGMEDALDRIASGSVDHIRFLSDFFRGDGDAAPGLERHIEEALPRIDYPALAVGRDPGTDEPLFVRIGKRHVYLRRGEKDGQWATVPVDLLIDELTPEKAADLIDSRLRGNRPLGRDDESGLNVYARSGPYGPYVQLGEDGDTKPKRASLPRDMSPEQVDLAYALRLLSLPRVLGKDPETGKQVIAGMGKFGPYVNREKTYRNLDALERAFDIGLEEALGLLNARPGRPVIAVLGQHPGTGEPLNVHRGRYGPYVTDGKVNASIPRGRDPASVGVDEALDLLAKAAARRAARKGASRTRAKRSRKRR